MKAFMDKDFLLETETAKKLYHDFAAQVPTIDYHCHINPKEIAENRKFDNITQVWLGGDHYKWRFMRSCGIEENISQVMLQTTKNSANGLNVLGKQSETHYSTGAT